VSPRRPAVGGAECLSQTQPLEVRRDALQVAREEWRPGTAGQQEDAGPTGRQDPAARPTAEVRGADDDIAALVPQRLGNVVEQSVGCEDPRVRIRVEPAVAEQDPETRDVPADPVHVTGHRVVDLAEGREGNIRQRAPDRGVVPQPVLAFLPIAGRVDPRL
jgi:hypothetical protein